MKSAEGSLNALKIMQNLPQKAKIIIHSFVAHKSHARMGALTSR